ncbi:type II toxin-antitoxin system VapC family toxin [Candidatus Collierbacteria bacterium]|nr:type II toxin-antitoxin system VapC family toxin [Candidatus Collierbacteria bacterium]
MGQKIYIDTNLYIAFFEGEAGLSQKVEKILIESIEKDFQIVISPLISMELLIVPLRENSGQLVNVYKNLKNHITNIEIADFTQKISEIAAKIRAKYNFTTPDCIHLATAIEKKVDLFYTADKAITKVKEIKVELI